ncbi:MAG: DUF4349 domain-containing protein [Firmicutes bacterium]|nr:DUF4349 domain-containing protein [Bacillota bacterium]
MKKIQKTAIILIFLLSLTACGSSSNETLEQSASVDMQSNKAYTDTGVNNFSLASAEDNADVSETEKGGEQNATDTASVTDTSDLTDVIQKDMIVYSGSLSVETLDFDTSYSAVKKLLDENKAFIENDSLSAAYPTKRIYTARIRIPSENYDKFMSSAGNIGDVISQSSNAVNVSQEYSENAKALEIYEAKEKRYIEQIASAQSEETVIQLEDRLTELQVNIARIKTRMSQLKTNVAYSTVDLTLSEVAKIQEKEKPGFGSRMKKVIKDSCTLFLNFCENVLVVFLYFLPYAVVILAVALIAVLFIKIGKKRKNKRIEQKSDKKPENGVKSVD